MGREADKVNAYSMTPGHQRELRRRLQQRVEELRRLANRYERGEHLAQELHDAER